MKSTQIIQNLSVPIARVDFGEDTISTFSYEGEKTKVSVSFGEIVGRGTAKCMPGDKYSREVGENIASARALKSLGEQLEQLWLGRSITEAEWKANHPTKENGQI